MKNPKVAIAHEFLVQFGGAEKTLEAIAEIFPDAPIFTARLDKKVLSESLKNRTIIAPKKNLTGHLAKYIFTFMMAPVFEQMDFSDFDIIISDGNTWNKGIITKPEQLHITYIHTPPRFLYKYSTESTKRNKWYLKLFFGYLDNVLRMWDFISAQRPDFILTNSNEVKKRIFKFYRREATVIYPPVETNFSTTQKTPTLTDKPYYVAVGRLVRYKNFNKLVQVFNLLDIPLVIVGSGPEENNLKRIANQNIIFAGKTSEQEKHDILEHALGLINTVEDEDLGIVPIEAMAHGIPVLVHKSGGHLETVQESLNGMFFQDSTTEGLIKSFKEFDNAVRNSQFDKSKIKESVKGFEKERFKRELASFVLNKWAQHIEK